MHEPLTIRHSRLAGCNAFYKRMTWIGRQKDMVADTGNGAPPLSGRAYVVAYEEEW